MKDKTLHMIGKGHIDPVWLWPWQEGFQEVKATFRSALDRIAEYDQFIFTCSSAAMYEWVELNDHAMFAEIKQRVQEGRWVIVGGWWVQPDCNLPAGESFVRQAVLGQKYFQEKFGVIAKVGFNVDSFGHHGMLPQILRKSGMDSYVFMRPMPHEKTLPGPIFWWESDDGSRVLTYRIIQQYETWGDKLEVRTKRTAEHLIAPLDELMMFYGVGNHGGGPTKHNIESIGRFNEQADMPKLIFSSPDQYFDRLREKGQQWPVVHDDLQHHASGCYSVHSGVKEWNRRAENRLLTAELFSSHAEWIMKQPYPQDYERAWKNVLFNQFHDILAGTSLWEAYEDARNEYGEALAIADRGLNYALQAISWNINIPQEADMMPVVVFNPHSWPAPMAIKVELGTMGIDPCLLDEHGRSIPVQTSAASSTTADNNGRFTYTFVDELPAMGYRTYRFYRGQANPPIQQQIEFRGELSAGPNWMENSRLRIEIDPETGTISQLYDKEAKASVFLDAAAQPAVIEDKSDTWSHGVRRFDQVIGAFKAVRVKLIEFGPVRSIIRVVSEYGDSRLVQSFILYRELDHIEVQVKLDWREKHKALKLLFPTSLRGYRPTYEIPYGHIVREADGEEEPGQTWIDYSGFLPDGNRDGDSYGLSILNDSKSSYSMNNHVMAITVLRSPIYAHHDPAVPDPEEEYEYIDQGIQRFKYTLLPHRGGWESAGTVQRARELNQPPIPVVESYHPGVLPQNDTFIQIDQSNVIASALKKAECGEGYILRLYETIKQTTQATIQLPKWGRTIQVEFGPCEIKSFFIPMEAGKPIVETDLIEREIQ